MKQIFIIAIAFLFSVTMMAQTTVKGNVTDAKSGDPLPGANIKVVGKSLGTTANFDGDYSLNVKQEAPFEITVSLLGYASKTVSVAKASDTINVSLTENASDLDEVVVSASRTPESVRESPVTVERMDARDIAGAASASFYNSLENLKGVDVNTSSLTFNSVNTRGFASFANIRFVQLVDGMDNASPALNFVMGNLVGVNELDLKSVELLPGASSALYGANAFNGILFMTTKSPFDDQGISTYFKKGITSSQAGGDNDYFDVGIRTAYAFSEKFAAKASFSYLKGTDWTANDYNQYRERGDTQVGGKADAIIADAGANGHNAINRYGDEVSTVLDFGAFVGFPGAFGVDLVGRKGYDESDLTDYDAKSMKADFSLNYRPFANDLELVANYRVGQGSTIYQGASRYKLNDFLIQQLRLELRNDNFFLRAYSTSEDDGNSHNMVFTGITVQRDFKSDGDWFGDYVGGYLGLITGAGFADPNFAALAGALGYGPGDATQAHSMGRILAENRLPNGSVVNPAAPARYVPGTPEFKAAYDRVTAIPMDSGGSSFIDKTSMKVAEGNYNFKELLNDVVDLQVGGNYRRYKLDSGGSIFTDSQANGGPIEYNEYGAYLQAVKKFSDDRLKVAASVRMDKNEYFDAAISPRLAINYAYGDRKQHNFRASYQTGFRNPTTQDLFIGFDVSSAILVGSSPQNLDKILPNTHLTGRDAYYDSYSVPSVQAFAASGDPSKLVAVTTELVKPEQVTAIDLGYRGKVGKVAIDFNVYMNAYTDFINGRVVITPENGSTSDITGVMDIVNGDYQVFSLYTNSDVAVNSYGALVGLSTRIGKGYKVGLNYTYSKLDFDQEGNPDYTTNFNTPEHKVKFSFGNANMYKNIGFNFNTRWNSEYLWEATIANAMIPSRVAIDAMINYSMPKYKSVFKVGGTNLGGEDYRSAPGAGFIGSQYFVSWTFNN